jgi:hypothetical protein
MIGAPPPTITAPGPEPMRTPTLAWRANGPTRDCGAVEVMRFSLVWLERAPDQAPRLANPNFAPMFLLHLPFFVISVDVTRGDE